MLISLLAPPRGWCPQKRSFHRRCSPPHHVEAVLSLTSSLCTLLAWCCCACVGGKDILSFGERCSLLCNPPVLHNLRQSAVPVFAPRNLHHLLLLLLRLSPLRCAVSSVREQPGLSRCRLFSFFFSTHWHRARPPEQMSEDSLPLLWRLEVGGLLSWCIMIAIFQCDTCTHGGLSSLWLLPLHLSFLTCCVRRCEGLHLFPSVLQRVWRRRPVAGCPLLWERLNYTEEGDEEEPC